MAIGDVALQQFDNSLQHAVTIFIAYVFLGNGDWIAAPRLSAQHIEGRFDNGPRENFGQKKDVHCHRRHHHSRLELLGSLHLAH